MRIEFLGTGTSSGVPVPACSCAVCRSGDRADNRFRCSLHVKGDGGTSLLIDCGPEFRLQALRAGIDRIDAVLLTHAHADHLHGLDDLRSFSRERPIRLYMNAASRKEVLERFDYAFIQTEKNRVHEGGGKPRLLAQNVNSPFVLDGLRITPIPLKHGSLDILGWRIDEKNRSLVYASDVNYISEASRSLMHKADVLILGALHSRRHDTHFSFDEALEEVRRLSPGAAWFTHFCHDHCQRDIVRLLAPAACPARDTLRIAL